MIWVHPAVAVVDHRDRVVAVRCDRPGARPLVLEDSAALIWHAAARVRSTSRDDVVAEVAERTGADPHHINGDIQFFVDRLVNAGLLVEGVAR